MPASSKVSRRTAFSIVSPGSMKPASAEYMPGPKCGPRPSRHRSRGHRQHDGDRIGARKMLGAAARAEALVAAGAHLGRLPAFAAEAVRTVPGEQRCALRQRAELRRFEQPLDIDGAVVDRLDAFRAVLRVRRPAGAASTGPLGVKPSRTACSSLGAKAERRRLRR